MKIRFTDSGSIVFEDGKVLNRNTLNRKRLEVTVEESLAFGESLWVQFGDNRYFNDVSGEVLEPIRLQYVGDSDTYMTLMPDEVMRKPGVWYMTLAVRLYTADGDTYQNQLTSEKVSFTINDSYPLEDGGYVSNGTVQNLYNDAVAAKNAAEAAQSAAEEAQDKAEDAQSAAEAAQSAAETAEQGAEAAKTGAQTAQTAAETAAGQAQTSAGKAAGSASAAATSAGQAAKSATDASNFATAAETAAGQAQTSAGKAAGSASEASQSALAAQGYMEQAREYAQKEYKVYPSFDDLPKPGDSAFIYLVPQTEGENNNYAEYLWISESQSYEFIGSVTDVDLSDYATINGSYPNMTVGTANEAGYADSAATADTAGYAAIAKADASGNDIEATYAKQSGSYVNMSVGAAVKAGKVENALTIVQNGETVTYDGSQAQTVTIEAGGGTQRYRHDLVLTYQNYRNIDTMAFDFENDTWDGHITMMSTPTVFCTIENTDPTPITTEELLDAAILNIGLKHPIPVTAYISTYPFIGTIYKYSNAVAITLDLFSPGYAGSNTGTNTSYSFHWSSGPDVITDTVTAL